MSLFFANRPETVISTAPVSRILPALLAATTCALVLGLTVLPLSATRIEAWPWAAFAALAWFLPVGVALHRLAWGHRYARFGGWLDAGFVLLALGATVSALASPVSGAILHHLLPVLGACALPYALLPWLQPSQVDRTGRISGLLIITVLGSSLLPWLEPWNGFHWPAGRNDQPFGHGNITGSVAVLSATWLAACAVRQAGRIRVFFAAGAVLAIITAVSSGSRGAVLALAVAATTATGIILIRRGRILVFALLAGFILLGALASNARLRELLLHGHWSPVSRESNDQRTAMIIGGLRLGAERPALGWGPGAVPYVFPRVRANLPGAVDNFLQLHNSPVQLWATLGGSGLLAGLLILVGLISPLRAFPWTPERIALAAGLSGAGTVLLFDHSFAVPVFALLVAAHLAAWSGADASPPPSRISRLVGYACLLLLVPALFTTARDLAARSAYADALDCTNQDDPAGYVTHLRRAMSFAPGDPYYPHQLAAHLTTGSPFSHPTQLDPAAAVALLSATLQVNPTLEYAHYNLGWLLLDRSPSFSAAHFLAAARLAPQRGGVYWGLGLARLRMGDTPGAVRAFATEWLLDPSFAWSSFWYEPPLSAMRPAIFAAAVNARLPDPSTADRLRHHWAAITSPAPVNGIYRRLRLGYGVLLGHPDGLSPVDCNSQAELLLPAEVRADIPAKGWLPGAFLLDFLQGSSR